MVGSTALRTQKGLLTRYCNNIESLLEKYGLYKQSDAPCPQDLANVQQSRELVFQLNATCQLASEALSKFTTALDSLTVVPTPEQEAQTNDYIERAQNAIEAGQRAAIELEAKSICAFDLHGGPSSPSGPTTQVTPHKLPSIPIPTFTGRVWEFENFWTLFEANVHNQPLTRLQKFNYLISALRGEAKDSVLRFNITEANYDKAVTFLRNKYGDESRLIDCLQMRLEQICAENSTLEGQRRLLETIMPIVAQLEDKGVSVNGSFFTQRVMSKFRVDIQRKVLEHCMRVTPQGRSWILKEVLAQLDEVITTEENIDRIVSRSTVPKRATLGSTSAAARVPCIFCNTSNHKSAMCTKYGTIEERCKIFKSTNRCFNCGSVGHFLNACPKEGCRNCGGKKHHHTLCPTRMENTQSTLHSAPFPKRSNALTNPKSAAEQQRKVQGKAEKSRHRNPSQAHANTLETESSLAQVRNSDLDTGTVLSTSHNKDGAPGERSYQWKETSNVFLLTGVAQVKDASRKQWRDVEVLLDTGADQSFITNDLADELGLERGATKKFQVYTFGAEQPRHTICTLTTVELWDQSGLKHSLSVHTLPIITATSKPAKLSSEDLAFIEKHKICLSKAHYEGTSKPQILIGCDQLWELLDAPHPHYTLPSGLHLVPSKLGYLLTGRQLVSESKCTITKRGSEREPTPEPISMNTFVNFETDFEDELDRWDKYWAIDSGGICEFTGTKNAEKEAVNKQVTEFFENTIQKRADGYYIRFPFKTNHPPLPSNKAIAMRRLRSVLQMLRKTPQLLEQYDGIIAAQHEQGIIEQVLDSASGDGALVHYIPHQPVVTPNKETTKLRIVFDASAHFKECPSLNDVLHQGPLILPELYAMLLRFRVPPYVAISDVEKAFLQVHLHEADRDVTRFLWVRDFNAPLEDSNIVTYRFTRVTFGLNVSPYLLGGTIHHHLRYAVSDVELAKEIRENLYVDNLVLSGETPGEIAQKSLDARKIFSDMGMNLREFTSNDSSLRSKLPKEACATPTPKKILGILWDAEEDHLMIRCSLPSSDSITKRKVARQIASIYDPFGWLVPLLTPAKKFQQDLWKHKFQWDTDLPSEMRHEWNQITENIDGFTRSFPRRFYEGSEKMHLAVFADASEIALATCAYLFTLGASTLVMAKSKLPSIKTKTTIPKLEMNAITIAMRLAYSISNALKSTKTASPEKIYIFSDSQIVLNWISSPRCRNSGILVHNRVGEIRRIIRQFHQGGVKVVFGYVHTSQNPADAGTRGLSQEQMSNSDWWTGPQFLKTPANTWPVEFYPSVCEAANEEQPPVSQGIACITAANTKLVSRAELLDWCRYRSFTAGSRIAALILRFIKRSLRSMEGARKKVLSNIPELEHISGTFQPLGGEEILAAKVVLLRNHQSIHLTEAYRKSMENTLQLHQDAKGIWRSRGRLKHATLQDDTKNPIFITPNTVFAQRIIQETHGNYHKGIEHTMAAVREHYWIPKLRQQVRKIITNCVLCRKFNALPYHYPDTPQLPPRRVQKAYPFQHTGLDFFDLPPCTEDGSSRKLYGCIFTCTVTRLIHLEDLRSMATEEFLNAFRRFVARRGVPESVTCDNAPTFILSADIVGDRPNNLQEDLQRVIANKGIKWNHITPFAPWQGGFYERLIKSIKHALYKGIFGTKHRSFDDLHTIIIEIEACLNSRPLTYQGSTHEELSSVRPIDFIQRDITLRFPEIETTEEDDPLYLSCDERRSMKYRQHVIEALNSSIQGTERFWKIWQQQYLTSLRETQKRLPTHRRLGQNTPAVGDVVLLSDPVLPRHEWKMARITSTKIGTDGKIREAELQTSNKRKIRRPVNLLIPLEIQEAHEGSTEAQPSEPEPSHSSKENPSSVVDSQHRYNLRRRQQNRTQNNTNTVLITQSKQSKAKWFLFYVMIISLIQPTFSENLVALQLFHQDKGMITAPSSKSPEIYTNTVYKTAQFDNTLENVRLSLEITMSNQKVFQKLLASSQPRSVEKSSRRFFANTGYLVCALHPTILQCRSLRGVLTCTLALRGRVILRNVSLYTLASVAIRIHAGVMGMPSILQIPSSLSLYTALTILKHLREILPAIRILSKATLAA